MCISLNRERTGKGKYDPSLLLAFKIVRLFELTIEDVFQENNDN